MQSCPSILIVEDELLVAMDLAATMADQGWRVLGPVSNVARALAVLEKERPDAACLDMNLGDGTSTPLAEVLVQENIPFVIVSGYSEKNLSHNAFEGAPLVSKPFVAEDLVEAISGILP